MDLNLSDQYNRLKLVEIFHSNWGQFYCSSLLHFESQDKLRGRA